MEVAGAKQLLQGRLHVQVGIPGGVGGRQRPSHNE